MDARDLPKGFQRHKSDSTTDLTDNCKPGTKSIDRTDKELGISDNILDFTDPTDCHKNCYKDSDILDDISDFTDPTVESTGCTDCTKPTDV